MKKLCAIALVLAVLVVSSVSFGQTDIGFKGIGGKIGYVAPEDPIESTIGFGAAADLGTITPAIHLGAFADYWSKSYDAGVGYGYSAEWSWTEITLGATGKYYFPLENSAIQPYAGAGLGFTIGKWKWEAKGEYIGSTSASESETDISFHVVGGADYALSPNLTGFAEVKYHTNGADYFGIFAGVIFKLGK